jgi:hypothetical protein
LNVKYRKHLRGLLPLFLACLFVTGTIFAERASAEFPLCQPERSPCCPQSTNTTNASCPACGLSAPIAAKDTSEQKRPRQVSQVKKAPSYRPVKVVIASFRELTPGLRYQRTVFDLKDDLRI